MPKLKTHKGTAARFRVTGGGKIMRMYGSRNNFRRKKRGQTLRELGDKQAVSAHIEKRLRRLLPYSK